jgi:hypothetical protein
MRLVGHLALMGERYLLGKPEGNRPLGRPRRKWENNIKMDLQEFGYEGIDWIKQTGQGEVVSTCECSNEPSGSM